MIQGSLLDGTQQDDGEMVEVVEQCRVALWAGMADSVMLKLMASKKCKSVLDDDMKCKLSEPSESVKSLVPYAPGEVETSPRQET